ncbi:hypothetical protein [Mycolicibacterium sphagni]|uniref:hypothetical protein n=1 Tax=Mycolicibacterium sphagni TaxID=1786 RepID=UPI0021F30107|nr:hypothetical protein [Mycolicibacterium sphagni]MCV7174811.1 hypothetical protein [Mycolicibacterium sphagni]
MTGIVDDYQVDERVLVNSALAFATVVLVEVTDTGRRYTVEFPDGHRVLRYWDGLTPADRA